MEKKEKKKYFKPTVEIVDFKLLDNIADVGEGEWSTHDVPEEDIINP